MEKEERFRLYEEAISRWGIEAQREMSYEELVIEFNNYISKNSIIILKKIIEICSNNIKKYGLILEKIFVKF